jgi:hypothetical protein
MVRRTDIFSGIVLALTAVLLLIWIIPAHTSPPQSEGNLSPAFLPSFATVVLLVLAILLTGSSLLRSPAEADEPHEEFGTETSGIGWRAAGDIGLWSAFSIAMMAGFLTIGFLATAIPALVFLMAYAGQRSPIAIGLVAVAIPLLIQQVSWHAFGVQMP